MTSRSDRIIALARKTAASNTSSAHQLNLPATDCTSSTCISDFSIPTSSKYTDVNDQRVVTDINKMWLRYVNFNDQPKIFDFNNEYQTSHSAITANDMTDFDRLLIEKEPFDNNLLKCNVTISSSDEENENSQINNKQSLFEDFDDSVKDAVTSNDMTDFDRLLNEKVPFDNNFLRCNEIISSSDKENENSQINNKQSLFEDFDDSVKDAVTSNDMTDFDRLLNEKEPFDNSLLKCNETISSSDEENENSQINNKQSLFEDSDDSVKDKDYIPDSDTTDTDCEDSVISRGTTFTLEKENTAIETDNVNTNGSVLEQTSTQVNCDSVGNLNNLEQLNLINNPVQEGKGLTKSGLPRKRQVFVESLTERKKIKKQLLIEKLSLKRACMENCRRKCSTNINEDQRKVINNYYSKLNKESQGIFIKSMVETKSVERRKQTSREIPKRKLTYAYFLTKLGDIRIEVCKQFFLTTLGYHPKNDQRVLAALKRPIDQQKDRRGVYERTNKIDRNTIKSHILGYNPAISHYRREHAPNKLYLPSDINVPIMYKNFCENFPDLKVSLETYRTVVKNELNISFTHLGNEECELCAIFKLHNPEHNKNPDTTCDVCNKFIVHKVRYTESRIKYKEDVDNAIVDKITIRYSVDLQKVIMLPRLDQYKASIFCPRIIAFNESFVPLGKTSKEEVPFAAVWNESISGRHQHDIISTFRAFLLHKRDAKNVILWADNCASQNKNWALMSFLVHVVNSSSISANTIEIRYFEPGHTFMSVDHFHHQVEKMLGKNKVYDFDDYVERVKMANNRKCIVKSLGASDFYLYEDLSSQYKLRNMENRIYLKDIMVVKVERGKFILMYKKGHNEMFQSLDFLQAKIVKTQKFPEAKSKNSPRGITADRKADIIQKLVPLMPENRRNFWLNIPVSNFATNLLTEEF